MRLAVLTGASGGIGQAVAEALKASGHCVVALGHKDCDVTDEAQVGAVFAELGPVDVLVNNAGIAESAPVHKTTLSDWERHLRVNATGAFLTTRAVLPGMRERGFGRLICVASTAALTGTPYTAAYTASKHAMLGLVRAVAAELAGTGVTSNAVCPAFVDTPMTQRSIERIVERTGRTPEAAAKALIGNGRLLEPEEVAAAVDYLASDAAAAVNGQTLVLDGGQT